MKLILFSYAGDFGVDNDSAAIFADDYFLAKLDFELFLRWDAVETAAARIALDVDNTKAVAGIFANAFEGVKCVGVDFGFEVFGLLAQTLFVLTGFRNDFLKFGFFLGKHMLVVDNLFLCSGDVGGLVLDLA